MTDHEIVNALCEITKVPADHLVEAIRHWRASTDTFCAWAQPYLDSSRWGGHDMLDAIRVELTERDAEVERLTARIDALEGDMNPQDVANVDARLNTYGCPFSFLI